MTQTIAPGIMTVRQVAQRLGVGKDAAYGLIARGDLRAVRIGRALRVTEEALADFLRGN